MRVERSLVTGNTDGGIQATLSGEVTAVENESARQPRHADGEQHRRQRRPRRLAGGGASRYARQPGRRQRPARDLGAEPVDRDLARRLCLRQRSDRACRRLRPRRVRRRRSRARAWTQAASPSCTMSAAARWSATPPTARFGTAIGLGRNAFAFNGGRRCARPRELPQRDDARARRHRQSVGALRSGDSVRPGARARPRRVPRVAHVERRGRARALATPNREAPRITAIEPSFAAAGELVRIYGTGLRCHRQRRRRLRQRSTPQNTCRPVHGSFASSSTANPASVVAVTPTMLVIRAPFTCVEPGHRGGARASHAASAARTFCTTAPPPTLLMRPGWLARPRQTDSEPA